MKNKKNPEFHRTGTFLLQFGIDTKDCLYLTSFICMALVGQIEYCEIVQDYVTITSWGERSLFHHKLKVA